MNANAKRVLVVEDNPVMLGIVRFNLERAGFNVQTCANGLEAVRLLRHESFDLITTDKEMPGMDGIELCRYIRGEERFASIPLFLISAKGLELDVDQLEAELSPIKIIYKPFSPSEIVQLIAASVAEANPVV